MAEVASGGSEVPIVVWDETEKQYLNLIAFEQCDHYCRSYITAYYHFMGCLIKTDKDVDILCREGIIDNGLGNEKLVASHFKRMVREASYCADNSFLLDVCDKINRYSKRKWPSLRASLVPDYFNSPWAIVSFLADTNLLHLIS